MKCKNCQSEIPSERAQEYDYCTKTECVKKCMKSLNLIAVHVNKAADLFELRENILIPEIPPAFSVRREEPEKVSTPRRVLGRTTQKKSLVTPVMKLVQEYKEKKSQLPESEHNKLRQEFNAKLRRLESRYRDIEAIR